MSPDKYIQQPTLQRIRIAIGTYHSSQQRSGDQLLLATSYVLLGSCLDECMALQQSRLPIHKLLADSLRQLIDHILKDDRLQGECRSVGGALDQHAAAQGFERSHYLALRRGFAQIGQ